jgi:hypothetical protein
MALVSAGNWWVMQTFGQWHKVMAYSTGGSKREAITKCGYNIPFPSADVSFTEQKPKATPNLMCVECYK